MMNAEVKVGNCLYPVEATPKRGTESPLILPAGSIRNLLG